MHNLRLIPISARERHEKREKSGKVGIQPQHVSCYKRTCIIWIISILLLRNGLITILLQQNWHADSIKLKFTKETIDCRFLDQTICSVANERQEAICVCFFVLVCNGAFK